ncbi:MAG: hypothetical protein DMF51_12915 [Acidobacteria bacterium]|nr:MAG: hypothetical protein DMF51_12915 [Acidobacteriota bacterium]
MKRALLCAAAVLAMLTVAHPVWAQAVTRDSQCTEVHGSNKMTYDCGFNVKNYVMGTPITFTMTYACSGNCGQVMSFGMRGNGFSPPGVAGHVIAGKRVENGVELTFVFDSTKKSGNSSVANGHFNMNVNMDDGSGNWTAAPCKVDVHLGD